MAKNLWLVSKSQLGGADEIINGVVAVIINKDSGQTATQIKAAAAAQTQAMLGGTYPSTYFDTATRIDELTGGPLKDDGDAYIIVPNGAVPTKVEG
jgi:hypothetical protein